jgi:hypothetical protein
MIIIGSFAIVYVTMVMIFSKQINIFGIDKNEEVIGKKIKGSDINILDSKYMIEDIVIKM